MADAPRTPRRQSLGWAVALRWLVRWVDRPAKTKMATACLRLWRENVDCMACQRIDGLGTALSAIFMNTRGDRTIVTYRDERIAASAPDDPERVVSAADAVLADNRYPEFVRPICEAARRRNLPVVLDGDRPTVEDDPLFRVASHVVFSWECLRETTSVTDLGEGLKRIAGKTDAFLAVSNGPDDIVYLEDGRVRRLPVFKIAAVDTLGAGDAFHGGFVMALAEGRNEVDAMRFGAAVAGIKCTRIGGSAGAPTRAEVEAFLEQNAPTLTARAQRGRPATGRLNPRPAGLR
jgi:sulfofructose kinase